MADQLRWFKVWTSICSDDDFDPSRQGGLVSLGRFAILGAYTALHGEKGRVEIMPDTLFRLTQTSNLDDLKCDIALKNLTFEEGKNRHGKITVTWAKWTKYQLDSTQAERQRASRSKIREEKIRKKEKEKEKTAPGRDAPPPPANGASHAPLKQDTGATAWDEIERLLHTVGRYGKPAYSSDAIAAAVADLGGFSAICDSHNLPLTKGQFLAAYSRRKKA